MDSSAASLPVRQDRSPCLPYDSAVSAIARIAQVQPCREVSESELVTLTREGDQDAFLELVKRYRFLIRAVARTYFATSAAVEDLEQEALIGLVKAVRDFKEGFRFTTFAELCVRRQVITFIKTQSRRKHSPLNGALSLDAPYYEGGEPLASFIPAETAPIQSEDHHDFLEQLAARCSNLERKVLSFYTRGYSFEEMAIEAGATVKAIDNAVWRIKVKARKLRDQVNLQMG